MVLWGNYLVLVWPELPSPREKVHVWSVTLTLRNIFCLVDRDLEGGHAWRHCCRLKNIVLSILDLLYLVCILWKGREKRSVNTMVVVLPSENLSWTMYMIFHFRHFFHVHFWGNVKKQATYGSTWYYVRISPRYCKECYGVHLHYKLQKKPGLVHIPSSEAT